MLAVSGAVSFLPLVVVALMVAAVHVFGSAEHRPVKVEVFVDREEDRR